MVNESLKNQEVFVINHTTNPSKTPFKITAPDDDAALNKVFEHMGSNNYEIIAIEQRSTTP
jgi:hypothetical protein